MFGNYLTSAIRALKRDKFHALLNIAGLAVGLASALLIGVYVFHELSYDRFFPDSNRIFRVSQDYYPSEDYEVGLHPASANANFAPQLKADYPQIEESVRLYSAIQPIVWNEEVPIQESGFMFVDSAFPEVFGFNWIAGDPRSALVEPYSLVLTQSSAEKYFGEENPIGQPLTFTVDRDFPMRVTGVIADLPENTHLDINAMMSMATLFSEASPEQFEDWTKYWTSLPDYHTYIKLQQGADIADLERQFPDFLTRYVDTNSLNDDGITVLKLTDIHLRSERTEELKPPGNIGNLISLSLIAVCILLIASINFINLSTARASTRRREVGMRKVVGAHRRQLVQQFLGEAILLALLALALAMVMVEILMPWFETLIGTSFNFSLLKKLQLLLGALILVVLVGLIAGCYPAFYLSSFRPSEAMKGSRIQGSGNTGLRQALIVLQFSISITLVIASWVINAQMDYARSIDLGINPEQVVIVSGSTRAEGLGGLWPDMKQELLAHPDILSVTSSNYVPLAQNDVTKNRSSVDVRGAVSGIESMNLMIVDYDFFETYGIELLAGRAFSEEMGTDSLVFPTRENPVISGALILNEAAAQNFGWTPEEAVGDGVQLESWDSIPVVGVTVNSYFEALTTPVEPLVFIHASPMLLRLESFPYGAIKISGANLPAILEYIDEVWQRYLPHLPLNRHFLDEDFDALYESEQRQAQMLTGFTILAIIIACFGLYGLAAFNAEHRKKEVGIRKVMGGSARRVILLLTKDFSKPVLISNLVAWPVAWVVMRRWLDGFESRIDLSPWFFIGATALALAVAFLTVIGRTRKAAQTHPAQALKYE